MILSQEQIDALRAKLAGRKINLCFGGGVDSTAMMVALKAAGITPDVITFADTGGEKPETLAHVHRMQPVMAMWGWPQVSIVRKVTKVTTPYTTLEGNCTENETLPSLAFGMKSCSIKWKQGPQDDFLMGVSKGPNKKAAHPLWKETQRAGIRIVKLIGYDAGKADIRRSSKAKMEDDNFDFFYPLQLLGWTRGDCVKAITEELGPDYVPVKSACFFCPASQKWELFWLAGTHPDLFERALAIERKALVGKHSRFDELFFGDTWESLVKNADSFPSSNTSVGLGRKFAWNQWARVNGVVDDQFRVIRAKASMFLEIADRLRENDNALDRRACA